MEAAPLWPRHRVPHWIPSHPVPFRPESLLLHRLVITQHHLLGALVQILADVCKAPSDSRGSFRPSMPKVEALLGNDRRQPLHVTVPGLSPQRFEFEAHHCRDLTPQSYVTDCAQIVVYHWWFAQTALSADWDTLSMAWVVRNSLWNASCASAQRCKHLVKSWAGRTLQASSIDMSSSQP